MIGVELNIMTPPLPAGISPGTPRDSGLTLRAHQFAIKSGLVRPDLSAKPVPAMADSLARDLLPDFDVKAIAAWMAD